MMRLFIFSCLILIPQLDARGLRVRRDINVPDSVCQDMWDKAGNNLIIGTDMNVNQDNIPNLFSFTQTGQTKLGKNVFTKFAAVLSSYLPGSGDDGAARTQKQTAFLSEILVAGGPVEAAYQWLKDNRRTTAATLQDFANDLMIAWFREYNKNKGSGLFSGFEHVFVGELRGNSVSGFHNWYQLYLLKDKPNGIKVNSVNRWDATAPPLMKSAFTWGNANKPCSSFFVGTSPAFEMALYSACFIGAGQASQKCNCKINNKQITIQIVPKNMQVVTTYPIY